MAPHLQTVWVHETSSRSDAPISCARYMKARYSRHYRISEDEAWLTEPIGVLRNIAHQSCKQRISDRRKAADQ